MPDSTPPTSTRIWTSEPACSQSQPVILTLLYVQQIHFLDNRNPVLFWRHLWCHIFNFRTNGCFLFYLTGTIQPNHLHCNWGWIGHFILFNKFQQWTYFCARYFDKGQLCILYCKKWFTILYISQKWGFKQQFIYSSCTFVFSSV